MKKVFAFLSILFFANCVFAQVSIDKASRKTAERCLKLCESYLLGGNVEAAISQAELGLSYDDSISDLYYIKAAAKNMNGAKVREILELSKIAAEKNNWIGYNEKGNRILYADLLSDTGKCLDSLEALDKEPFIFSADAEAIRIKNYYRIGTDEYLSKARAKINSARRIYKGDIRFISLFFIFETAICLREGKDYEIPDQVLELADLLNAELKSYNDVSDEILALSFFYMNGEAQERAIKSFRANEKSDIFYPVIALKAGVMSERDAFDLFFSFADEAVPVEMLKYFSSLLTDDEVKQSLYEHLNAYNGTLFFDSNKDNKSEGEIKYERGRPQYIHYDFDNDGFEDLYGTFDFGELLSVCVKPLGMEIYYSPYPYLGRVLYTDEQKSLIYEFSKNAALFSPVAFDVPDELQVEGAENRFYVPFVKDGWDNKSNLDYLLASTYVRGSTSERENGVVTYSLLDGNVVSADFSVNGIIYARADFTNNMPEQRIVDSDGDGIFETTERFLPYSEENINKFSADDKSVVKSLFPPYDYSDKVYLSGIFIDYNKDNYPEYQETYRENDGKNVKWIFDDGRSQTFVRYPHEKGEPVVEEAIFVTGFNKDRIVVETVDGIPSSVDFNGRVYKVYRGASSKFYWIGNEYSGSAEENILDRIGNVEPGTVILVNVNEKYFKCIKAGELVFAKEGDFLTVSDMDVTGAVD